MDIPDAFTELTGPDDGEEKRHVFNIQKCSQPFSVEVTSLEYIDPENIAVSILKAPFTEYDPTTGTLDRSKVTSATQRQIMFMNTATMALRETPWRRNDEVPTFFSKAGTLCPAMRRLPNVGSIATELAISGVALTRPVLDLAISLPGLVEIWRKQASCPMVTHGHSLLRKCGSDLLSLDDFFDALNRANSHYWRAFGMIAKEIRGLGEPRTANMLDGLAFYGEASQIPIAPSFSRSLVRSMKIPGKDIADGFITHIRNREPIIVVSSNPLRMAQFSYKLIVGSISEIMPLLIRTEDSQIARENTREILQVLTNRFYDAREAFHNSITLGGLQACNGLSLILGYTNPWAMLIRKQCQLAPLLLQGIYDIAASVIIDVPFAKCICVDAAKEGASFEEYAMQNCYYFAPNHLKPMVLGMIQDAVRHKGAGIRNACSRMVDYASSGVEKSFDPIYSNAYAVAEQIADSVDYLLRFMDPDAGR